MTSLWPVVSSRRTRSFGVPPRISLGIPSDVPLVQVTKILPDPVALVGLDELPRLRGKTRMSFLWGHPALIEECLFGVNFQTYFR